MELLRRSVSQRPHPDEPFQQVVGAADQIPLALGCDLAAVAYLIVGDGPERERLEGSLTSNGLTNEVVFTGSVPDEEIASYYQATTTVEIFS